MMSFVPSRSRNDTRHHRDRADSSHRLRHAHVLSDSAVKAQMRPTPVSGRRSPWKPSRTPMMMCGNRSPASRPAHSYRTRTCGASCTRWRKAACARWCSAARCPPPAARRPPPATGRDPTPSAQLGPETCGLPAAGPVCRRSGSGVAAGPGLPLGLGSRRARVAVEWAPSDGGRERLPPASTPTPDRSEAIRCRDIRRTQIAYHACFAAGLDRHPPPVAEQTGRDVTR